MDSKITVVQNHVIRSHVIVQLSPDMTLFVAFK